MAGSMLNSYLPASTSYFSRSEDRNPNKVDLSMVSLPLTLRQIVCKLVKSVRFSVSMAKEIAKQTTRVELLQLEVTLKTWEEMASMDPRKRPLHQKINLPQMMKTRIKKRTLKVVKSLAVKMVTRLLTISLRKKRITQEIQTILEETIMESKVKKPRVVVLVL